MTRPDARLLVPVSALPRVPEGARRWRIVCAEWVHTTEFPYWSGDLLDLSRPDVVDGVPVRLDALAWALGVLGCKPSSLVHKGYSMPDCYTVKCPLFGAQAWISRSPAPRARVPVVVLGDRWPDLSGLSDDDASRAVVAAALRGGA